MATQTMSKDDILEAIGNMSVFELAELIDAFKSKFGVTIAAPAAAPAGGGAGGAGAPAAAGGEAPPGVTGGLKGGGGKQNPGHQESLPVTPPRPAKGEGFGLSTARQEKK